jgi:hypothetical protein
MAYGFNDDNANNTSVSDNALVYQLTLTFSETDTIASKIL